MNFYHVPRFCLFGLSSSRTLHQYSYFWVWGTCHYPSIYASNVCCGCSCYYSKKCKEYCVSNKVQKSPNLCHVWTNGTPWCWFEYNQTLWQKTLRCSEDIETKIDLVRLIFRCKIKHFTKVPITPKLCFKLRTRPFCLFSYAQISGTGAVTGIGFFSGRSIESHLPMSHCAFSYTL